MGSSSDSTDALKRSVALPAAQGGSILGDWLIRRSAFDAKMGSVCGRLLLNHVDVVGRRSSDLLATAVGDGRLTSQRIDFGVVIPTFNDGVVLVEAVNSALSQAGVVEVIVVDDGSTEPLARETLPADQRVRCLRTANGGPGAARNFGAAQSSASILVFLDADDLLTDGAGEAFARGFADDDSVELVRTGYLCERADGQADVDLARVSAGVFPQGPPLTATFAIRASLFKRIGGYDTAFRFGENSELLTRAIADIRHRGGYERYVGEPTLLYRPNEAGREVRHKPARAAAAVRMVDIHGALLSRDERFNHLSIAAVSYRGLGQRSAAVRAAARAIRLRPMSVKGWARLVRAVALR